MWCQYCDVWAAQLSSRPISGQSYHCPLPTADEYGPWFNISQIIFVSTFIYQDIVIFMQAVVVYPSGHAIYLSELSAVKTIA